MPARSSPRPRFTGEEAERLARDLYGLRGVLKELPSERDQNFHIRAESGGEFVLKIANAAEKKEVLEFQNKAVCRLRSEVPQFAWPEIRETVKGEEIATVEHPSGSRHLVRLLDYLPGPFLAQVRPHGRELLCSQGAFLGAMDRALAGLAERMKERGILISTEGPFRNVLKIRPPLVFTKANTDFLLENLERVL
jgi:Ser/Thr protein kinase RdoA (MazF antagonist)